MTRCMAVAGMILMAAAAAPGIEISEELRLAIQRDVETIEQKGPKMGEVMAALREAGASYLPELVAPPDVNAYQTMLRRRMMTGVYFMDLTYAATFAQRAAAARSGQAACQLLEQVGYPQPDLERRYREALDQVDLPGGDERLEQLFKEQNQNRIWQDMLESGEGVEIVVDGLYGFLVEGLYLTCELCVLSNYDPAFLMYVAYMRESFETYKQLLYRIGDNPELAMSIERHDRLDFLTSLLVIFGELPELGPAQVDSMRPAIAQARRDMVH